MRLTPRPKQRPKATGGSTQIVDPALGDPNHLLQHSKTCVDRLAALQKAGCRIALLGFGEKGGRDLFDLDPVYDWYVEKVNEHAMTCNIMVVSLTLKLVSDQITLFDRYHVKNLPDNRQALAGFVMDCASLLHIMRLVEHVKKKLNDVASLSSLPSLAARCVEFACRVEQRVQEPALLSSCARCTLFKKSDVSACRLQHVFSGREEKIRQELLCSKLFPGRSWSLWLDGFFNIPKAENRSETRAMWSEEKAVHPLEYDPLPLLLRKEMYKSCGVSATSWRYQPVAGYDVWFVMNAWEMAKLRRYYLHSDLEAGTDTREEIWRSWQSGFKPIPDPCEPSKVYAEDFTCPKEFAAALKQYEKMQAVCRELTQIQHDFGKLIDAFVDFLLVVPPSDGENASTSAMKWKFNPHLGFCCLERGLAMESDFGKYAFQQLAEWSSHVYVDWLALYECSLDVDVLILHTEVHISEVTDADCERSMQTRRWGRKFTSESIHVEHGQQMLGWIRSSSEVPGVPTTIDGFGSARVVTSCLLPPEPVLVVAMLPSRVEQRVQEPALLSFCARCTLFKKSDVSACRLQHVFSGREEKIRQELLCSKLFPGRSWSLWLDGFFNIPKAENRSETRAMWSEEKAVHPLEYDPLPLLLRKEMYKSCGVSATSWRYQPVAGYDVWFVMNAWEMAKLRRYYLHSDLEAGTDTREEIWRSWQSGFKPIPDPCEPSKVYAEDFTCPKEFAAALKQYEKMQAVCRELTQIQHDFGKLIDAFVDFLLVVPPSNGENASTSVMKWKFNPHLGFCCLERGLAMESDFGKYAFQQLAEWSSHVYVHLLAVYESALDFDVLFLH